MILVILFISLLIIGVTMVFVSFKRPWNNIREGFEITLIVLGIIFGLTFSVVAISQNSDSVKTKKKIWYEETVINLQNTYNYIITITDDKTKSYAIDSYNSKVKEFKIEILTNQSYLDNPWISWLNCSEYKNMDSEVVKYIRSE